MFQVSGIFTLLSFNLYKGVLLNRYTFFSFSCPTLTRNGNSQDFIDTITFINSSLQPILYT